MLFLFFREPSLDRVAIHVVHLFLPFFFFFLSDLEMPLDESLVIDKSIFSLGVTCAAVPLGNSSVLRTRLN